jgi:oligopeptide/dipeptide ABC transporter ATP-binding protein
MEELLRVNNLSIGIHNVHNEKKMLSAVEDISFDIKSGESLGIVGESGAGKTLTALSIPGLLGTHMEVTGGEIIFSGRNLTGMPDKALQAIRGKEISMIFQEPFSSLNPLVKVGAQIAETLELHGEKNRALAESKAKELMERLGLPENAKTAKTYPHRLSGGMCQRVMIALAVIGRPRLLIADEPTTALDSDTQGQILALLKEINEDMRTSILFISHDLEVIKNLCGRVLVMYSGRILEEGNTDEVFFHPAHEYTRCLLNSVPDRAKKGMDLIAIPGEIPSLEEGRPRGCPFHPRCEKAMPSCAEEFPQARAVSATHATRCVLAEGK